MKYKKHLLFLLVIMVIGVNRTYAMNINYSQNSLINILEVGCNDLFDQSLIDLLNDILKYPRIIVPILVIGLGLVDLGKAVMASKEDEMRKAQKTFIKRVIIGVAFFFIPALVNIIMWLANIVWNGMYPTCGL